MNKDDFLRRMEQVLSPLPLHERIEILGDYVEHFRAGEEQGKTAEEIAQSLGSPEELGYAFLEERGMDTSHIQLPEKETAGQAAAEVPSEKEEDTYIPPIPPVPAMPAVAFPQPPAYPPVPSPVNTPMPNSNRPVYVQAPPQPTAPYHSGDTGLATVLVVLFNVLFAVPVILAVCSAAITIPVLALAFFVAAVALFITSIPVMVQPMAGAALICLAIAFLALSVLFLVAAVAAIKGLVKLLVMYFRFCGRICREGRWPTGKEVAR